jgi:glycosyltransferase involved in cell wall biosynthesis
MVQALASTDHELVLVSPVAQNEAVELGPLSAWCREIVVVPQRLINMSRGQDYTGRLTSLARFRSYAIERFRSPQLRERLESCLKRERFDVIIIDGLYSLVNLPGTEVPFVLNCHNIEHLIFDRYVELEKNAAKRWYARVEARWIKREEKVACQRATAAMVCSELDRSLLRTLNPNLRVFVAPNTVDTDIYVPVDTGDDMPQQGNPILLYLGSMDWYPNRDAVEFFASEILPKIRQEIPGVRFTVAGRNPARDFVDRFAGVPGMEFTGTVPDIRPYLSAAAVVVVPLRLGSGTRIKILEASAAGRPVVSTRLGAEGLDLTAGKEILLADQPTEFSRAVLMLLRDPQRRRGLARSAREKVVQNYSHLALQGAVQETLACIQEGANREVGSGAVGGDR